VLLEVVVVDEVVVCVVVDEVVVCVVVVEVVDEAVVCVVDVDVDVLVEVVVVVVVVGVDVLDALPVVGMVPGRGNLIGVSSWSLAVTTVFQSFSSKPPVSPESGFQDQNVHEIESPPLPRYGTRVFIYCKSDVTAKVVPNSPNHSGARLCLKTKPQCLSQIPGMLAG